MRKDGAFNIIQYGKQSIRSKFLWGLGVVVGVAVGIIKNFK